MSLRIKAVVVLLTIALAGASCGSPPPVLPDSRQKTVNLNIAGGRACKAGDYQRALSLYAEALRADRAVEDTEGIAMSLYNLAVVYRKAGDPGKAHECLDAVLNERRLSFSARRLSEAAYLKALIYADSGDAPGAGQWADRSLAYCGGSGCAVAGPVYNLKGTLAMGRGDAAAALTSGRKGLSLNDAAGDSEEEANSQRIIAGALAASGEYEGSLKHYQAALEMDKSLGLGRKVALDLLGMGDAYRAGGKKAEASDYYHRALSASENAGYEEGAIRARGLVEKGR